MASTASNKKIIQWSQVPGDDGEFQTEAQTVGEALRERSIFTDNFDVQVNGEPSSLDAKLPNTPVVDIILTRDASSGTAV